MDQNGWNWWSNWRFFDALTKSGKIFDRYGPQNFWKTVEVGAKKWVKLFWLLWLQNFGASEQEKE